MRAFIPLERPGLAIWLGAFFSPTIYFLLLLVADSLFLPSPPERLVASLFYLIPPLALLICGFVVWSAAITVAQKVGWVLLTCFGMLLQFGILLAILVVATGFTSSQ